MVGEPEPEPPLDGEPIPFVPDDLAPELSETELVADIWSAQARQSREHAMELEAIARLARRRRRTDAMARGANGGPGVDSRAAAPPEIADISEDFVAEVALIRGCSEAEASALAREAILMTTTLAPSWSELFAGRIGTRHVGVLVDLLGDASAEVTAEVQRRVLPRVEGMTAAALRDRVRYHLYRLDAEAKERRRREAARRIDVQVWPKEEGVSTLGIDGPTATCLAAASTVDSYARMLRADGDERPMGVLRSEAALDLLLRPFDSSRPPVTAVLTIHAALPALRPDGDPAQTQQPAEVDGRLVSAAECRELLRELGVLGLSSPPTSGSIQVAIGDPITGELLAVATRADLRRGAGAGRRRRVRRRCGPGWRPPPTGRGSPARRPRPATGPPPPSNAT